MHLERRNCAIDLTRCEKTPELHTLPKGDGKCIGSFEGRVTNASLHLLLRLLNDFPILIDEAKLSLDRDTFICIMLYKSTQFVNNSTYLHQSQ